MVLPGNDTLRDAHALLSWYVDAGADEAIGNEPVNRYEADADRAEAARASSEPAKRNQPVPAQAQSPARSGVKAVAQEQDATKLASAAASLDALEETVRNYHGCALRTTAKNTCFADGTGKNRVMVIGEAPGREEDLQGKPFVGRAGQLLDRMLSAIGLVRAETRITNTVFWRPPGNRTPSPDEIAACQPFTERHIELIDPAVIILTGGAAAKTMLKTDTGIMRLRGRWKTISVGGRDYPAMPTLHPAYLLRQPAQKRMAWQDLLEVRLRLEGSAS